MNWEQIHKLAVQAGLIDRGNNITVYREFDHEWFAELIMQETVQECLKAAEDPADGLIKGDTWHDGVRASCWSIKQHFGVNK